MSQLKDPLNNRVVKDCTLPFQTSLTQKDLFKDEKVDWKLVRDFLKHEGKLDKSILLLLIKKAVSILRTSSISQKMSQI